MKKILYSVCLLASALFSAQKNTFLQQEFWKSKPSIDGIKKEIAAGNNASEKNGAAFDPVTLAINSRASADIIKFLIEQQGNSVSKITHDGRIYLHWAAMSGNTDIIEYLIKKGSDVNLEDSKGLSPLAFAANAGISDPKVYQLFFDAGINPKKRYRNGATIMMMGAGNDKDGILRNFLATKGLSLTDTDTSGATVFDYASSFGNLDILKSLISEKAKPTDKAILNAAQGTRSVANGLPVYQYLIEDLKLNPKAVNDNGATALHIIARKNDQSEIIKYLISKGVNPSVADKDGNTALMMAAGGKDLNNVKTLLDSGKNINSSNEKAQSALTFAVENGTEEIVSYLITNKADTKITDKSGNSLAYYLVQSYRPAPENQKDQFARKLEILSSNYVDLTKTQAGGNTLYHLAVAKNDTGILNKMNAEKININALNSEKMTALQKAALIAKNDEMMKFLIAKGADKSIKTEFDETAYDLASENEELKKNKVSIDFLK